MDNKLIEKMYESFPDSETFDESQDFDAFLVGDGSAHLIKQSGGRSNNSSNQLTGINSVRDLYETTNEVLTELEDDMAEFSQDPIPVDIAYDDFLFAKKKEYLDKFGFLQERSKLFKGRPIRERDLVINNDDGYLLHYMESHNFCSKQNLAALAQLSACKDMGFNEVKFSQVDGCPLCIAYEGAIYQVSDLISRFGSGQAFIHEGCFCEFIPVIRSRKPFENIQDGLTLSAYIGKVYFKRLPLEFVDFITPELVERIPYEEVSFVNFDELGEEASNLVKVKFGDVVLDLDNSIWIHENYASNYSPFDFLVSWLDSLKVKPVEVTCEGSDSQDILYLNGRRVRERDGNYIDIETGEVVSMTEGDVS